MNFSRNYGSLDIITPFSRAMRSDIFSYDYVYQDSIPGQSLATLNKKSQNVPGNLARQCEEKKLVILANKARHLASLATKVRQNLATLGGTVRRRLALPRIRSGEMINESSTREQKPGKYSLAARAGR